jgi:hypothetical protein
MTQTIGRTEPDEHGHRHLVELRDCTVTIRRARCRVYRFRSARAAASFACDVCFWDGSEP